MRIFIPLALAAMLALPGLATAQRASHPDNPVIVLVHGAFADASSWAGVIVRLKAGRYDVIAAAIASIVESVRAPVILVGHSYGGPVITEAANGNPNVKALGYVAGFAPEAGETSLMLSAKFPGSTLGDSLKPVALPDGDKHLYIRPEIFRAQFAADVPASETAITAATQRPVTLSALGETSRTTAWKTLPPYMIYGTSDRNIAAAVMKFMAERAQARRTIAIEGGLHAVMASHQGAVAALIEDAAAGK